MNAYNARAHAGRPQISSGVFEERTHQAARQAGGRRVIDLTEMDPIEANQAVLRTQPQETVMRLQNRIDGWLKQSFFFPPNAVSVLREGFVRIERVGGQT